MSTDSSAAKSFASERDLGRMRHIEVKELWLQEAFCRGRITPSKVEGSKNAADMFPAYLPHNEVLKHCRTLNFVHKIEIPGSS